MNRSNRLADPERSAELADSVSMAALVLLERLSPLERAVFVLREVFGFAYSEIAEAVDRSEVDCRQLVARARRHISAGSARFQDEQAKSDEFAKRFLVAFNNGDRDALRELLAADVNLIRDSGGKAPWFADCITGAENVATLLAALVPPFLQTGGSIQHCEINGHAGAILRDKDGLVISAFALDIADEQIQTIRSITNPNPLHHQP